MIRFGHSRRAIRIFDAPSLGGLGLVTYVINDTQQTVTLADVTWTGWPVSLLSDLDHYLICAVTGRP